MKKELENAISIEEQIKNLLDLGLINNNVDYAKNILNNVSYNRLIKDYSLGLKQKNCNYYDGKTFDEIIQLYEFNTKFRQLLFPEIEKIEVMMRCRLSNYFSTTYGVLGYKNSGNFKNGIYYDDFLNDMQAELDRNKKAPFVRNFNENYDGNIPFYALVELFSFGTLSKFFKNMKNIHSKRPIICLNISICWCRFSFLQYLFIMDFISLKRVSIFVERDCIHSLELCKTASKQSIFIYSHL